MRFSAVLCALAVACAASPATTLPGPERNAHVTHFRWVTADIFVMADTIDGLTVAAVGSGWFHDTFGPDTVRLWAEAARQALSQTASTPPLRGTSGGDIVLQQDRPGPGSIGQMRLMFVVPDEPRPLIIRVRPVAANAFLDALTDRAAQSHLAAAAIPSCGGRTKDERAQMLSGPPPDYPAHLRQEGISGRVVFTVMVTEAGVADLGTARVLFSDHPDLTSSSRRSVARATFRPAMREGRPVPCRAVVPYNFMLGGDRHLRRP